MSKICTVYTLNGLSAHLKVIIQCYDVAMSTGHLFEHSDLIPNLNGECSIAFPSFNDAIEADDEYHRWKHTICSRPSISFLLMTLHA